MSGYSLFELKLADGSSTTWDGEKGRQAAQAYQLMHPEVTVLAWRPVRRKSWGDGILLAPHGLQDLDAPLCGWHRVRIKKEAR